MAEQASRNEMRCFDCGQLFPDVWAYGPACVGSCPKCITGMLLVYTHDGEPVNRGFWDESND